MTLKGNIRDFTLPQLLNLINLARKSGTLFIEDTTESANMSFREGKLAYAEIEQEDNRLATILYHAKKISQNQHRVISERAVNMSDKELGLLLVNANYITQQDILNSLHTHFVSVIQRVFSWIEGVFQFDKNLPPPDDKITLRIGLENLIIEGIRRMREWEHLQDEIPSLEMALKFNDKPSSDVKNLNLSQEEWKVIPYINPKNTIQQIAHVLGYNDLVIRRIVYTLLQAGVVEMIRPEGMPTTSQVVSVLPEATKEQRKTLIGRLIDRIRAL